jgi:hypothetical protein
VTCEQRTDSIYSLAAGALPDGEAEELRRHLATGCPQCAAELAGASAAAALLPLSLDPVTPPAGLKDRLMRRIDESKRTAASVPDTLAVRLFRLFVPAAVAAGITLVATHFYMNRRVNDARSQADAYRRQAFSARELVVQIQSKLDDRTDELQRKTSLVAMLQSPDVRFVDLAPTDLQKGAVARLVWDQPGRKWAVLVSGMKPAAAGQTYEIWFVTKAGAKVRAGLFDVDAGGSASVEVAVPPNLGPLQLLAVTNEKAGGVDQPQGQFQLTGKL